MAHLRKLLDWLTGPRLLFWLLPALILLIATGTVAQKYIGLYRAETVFFSSFIIWGGGWLPLPGGYSLMGLLSLSLLLKFILKSRWTRTRAGINLAHFGALLLLIGGLISALLAEDGYMTIGEGDTSAQVQDYHERQLLLVRGNDILAEVPATSIQSSQKLVFAGSGLELDVLAACRNCAITRRSDTDPAPAPDLQGMARGMSLSEAPPALKDEENTGGLTFRVHGLGAQDGTYILFEGGPATKLTLETEAVELVYTKALRTLPFTVQLTDFMRTTYPGTDTASAYHSDVVITDGAVSWPARIEMNKPLRYRGHTLYQSSFGQAGEQEFTVLAVSRDAGQFIPYAGTALLAAGLILHLILRRREVQP